MEGADGDGRLNALLEEALKPWRRYADFSGRARRREYWLFILLSWLPFLAVGGVGYRLGWRPIINGHFHPFPGTHAPPVATATFALLMAMALAMTLPWLAVQTRRFHDREHSAWMLLWNLVPYIGWAVILYYMVLPGDPDRNFYGPAPNDPEGLRLRH